MKFEIETEIKIEIVNRNGSGILRKMILMKTMALTAKNKIEKKRCTKENERKQIVRLMIMVFARSTRILGGEKEVVGGGGWELLGDCELGATATK